LRVAWLHGVSPQASNQSGRLAFAALGIAALPLGSTLGSHSRQRGALVAHRATLPSVFASGCAARGAIVVSEWCTSSAPPCRIVLSASRRSHFPGATPQPSMSGPSPFRPATRGAYSRTACARARVRACVRACQRQWQFTRATDPNNAPGAPAKVLQCPNQAR
jgi:hypothetical protein